MKVRTRIAPSPTGIAHIGTAYIGLINYAFAKANNGKFVLRIEDTDRERYVPQSEQVIYRALSWLGINYDEGPQVGGPFKPYTQSKRLNIYKKQAQKLIENNKAYYCFCSHERLAAMRKAQQKKGIPPMYDGSCRKLSLIQAKERVKKESYVIRLKTPKRGSTNWQDLIRGKVSFANRTIDDQVLLKSDSFPTYHLAVVIDDHLMQISHIIRGEEWISSTPKHIILYNMFGWEQPKFAHTPLLRNPDRSKLSKRKNNVSILWYKEHGFLPEALVNYLCLMGWSHPKQKEKFPLKEFIKNFSLVRIQTTQPIFDIEKLRWLNGLYIREKTEKELFELLRPFLPRGAKKTKVRQVIPLVHKRLQTLNEFSDYTEFFFSKPKVEKKLLLKQGKHSDIETKKKIMEVTQAFEKITGKQFNAKKTEEVGRKLVSKDWNARKLFMTIRVTLTGKIISPPLFESIEVLGKKETIKRLDNAITSLD